MASVLGLDVGGANLKASHTGGGVALSRPFALWRSPGRLANELRTMLDACPAFDRLAVTMTGELCDCFASKREGVNHILDAVAIASADAPVAVWTNEGAFVNVEQARREALKVASANWLAQATFAARRLPSAGSALLIDVGTTTTDVIPISGRTPIPAGRTDPERLHQHELLYRGWRRTPMCVLVPGAAELFATMHDVCLALGLCPEDESDHDTADSGPATVAAAWVRIARMVCADLETSTHEERYSVALLAKARLTQEIAAAVGAVARRLPRPVEWVITSGSGEFLLPPLAGFLEGEAPAEPALEGEAPAEPGLRGETGSAGASPSTSPRAAQIIPYSSLAPGASAVACADAVAVLCQEAMA